MTENNVQTVSVITADLFPDEERFEMHLGGTTYEVSTHFNPDPANLSWYQPLQCPVVRKGENRT